jgi:acyl-coenzyme A synthetase/AMP-(fatty) acid ligase
MTENKNNMPGTVLEAVFTHAENMPDKVAVIDANGKTTYGELAQKIKRMAFVLLNMGVKKGDRILFHAKSENYIVAVFFGCQYIGAIPVPIPLQIGIEDLKYRIDTLECKFAFLQDEYAEKLNTNNLTDLINTSANGEANPVETNQEDISNIRFTSATTGRTKAVICTHKTLYSVAQNYIYCVPDEPIFTIFGNLGGAGIILLSSMLLYGGIAVLSNKISSVHDLSLFIKHHSNIISCSQTEINILYRLSKWKINKIFQNLKVLILSGMPTSLAIKRQLLNDIPNTTIIDGYGSVEAPFFTGNNLCINGNEKLGSVGKPFPSAKIKIVDDSNNEIMSNQNNPGRIAVKGDFIMKGYWRNEEATNNTLIDGWILMNDMGYMDNDGYLFLLGRSDDIINIDGRKVSPLLIEESAACIPSVFECCCIGVDDPLTIKMQVPVLFVVMKENMIFDEKELSLHIARHLDKYQIPYRILQIEAIPKNVNGKFLRRELKQIWEDSQKNITKE